MKKLILISFLSTLLLAQNPKVYSSLGDDIYDNIDYISGLLEFDEYNKELMKITMYRAEVLKVKDDGFSIENGDKNLDKLVYLKSLRELSKNNDYYLRSIQKFFHLSIKNENSKLFSQIVNSQIIDVLKYKDKIMNYYMFHASEINPEGVIQIFLDEDKYLRNKKTKKTKIYMTKKQLQAAKIKRIRARDKIKQAKIEKQLQDDVDNKKLKIREEQRRELIN